jgi:hypothetical protein
MHLWRPVGLKEMALVFDSGMSAFPPRLPEQPIFYPVYPVKFGVTSRNMTIWFGLDSSVGLSANP